MANARLKGSVQRVIVIGLICSLFGRDAAFAAAARSEKKEVKAAGKVTMNHLVGAIDENASGASNGKTLVKELLKGVPRQTQSAGSAFRVDPASGNGFFSLPLEMPEGRGGVRPEVVVSYSPRSGNGPLGLGWGIQFGAIERSTRDGVPHYDARDRFVAVLPQASSDLVEIGPGKYRAKIENANLNFQFKNTHWEVRNGHGMTYYYGLALEPGDRSQDKDEAGRVFRWRLSKAMDQAGNFYLIRYQADGGFEIFYTGEPGTAGDGVDTGTQKMFARVITEMEETPRRDRIVSYRAGMREEVSRRIKAIAVYATGRLQRRYQFRYSESPVSGRSLLNDVTEYGSDGVTAMPSLVFDYTEPPAAYTASPTTDDPVIGDNLWNVRYNGGYDRGHDNYGAVPPWHMIPLGPSYTSAHGDQEGVRWDQNGRGSFTHSSKSDVGNYFSIYLYSLDARTLNVPMRLLNDSNPGFWLNGDYSRDQGGVWKLKAGYNLVEMTNYHQHQGFSFDLNASLADQVEVCSSTQMVIPHLSGDFNGDGFADVGTFFPHSGLIKIARSSAGALLPKETWLKGVSHDEKVILGDFNVDGRTDAALVNPVSGVWRIALSDGGRFVLQDQTWVEGLGSGGIPVAFDIDGDGAPDALHVALSGGAARLSVARNEGASFVKESADITIDAMEGAIVAGDFNGDGLGDIGSFDQPTGSWRLYHNTGRSGFVLMEAIDGFGRDKGMVTGDVNGDGLTDIGYVDGAAGEMIFRASRGDRFALEEDRIAGFGIRGSDLLAQVTDYSGDGRVDFIVYNQIGHAEFLSSNNTAGADLLTRMDNGIGGTTRIFYAPSTQFKNTYLPFVFPLVRRVEFSTPHGYARSTDYDYEGGWWKPEDREFYGFAKITEMDSLGRYKEITCFQSNFYQRAQIATEIFYSPDHKPRFQAEYGWRMQPAFFDPALAEIKIVEPTGVWYTHYGDSQYDFLLSRFGSLSTCDKLHGVCLKKGSTFSGYYNWTVSSEYVQSYEARSIASDFRDDLWLLGYPALVYQQHRMGDGTDFVQKRRYTYDDHGFGMPFVSIGRITRSSILDRDSNRTELEAESYEYDRYGNQTARIDDDGSRTEVVYDPEYHMFPVRETNPEGHVSQRSYYGVNGVPLRDSRGYHGLFGQLHSMIDPNGISEAYIYDAVGRLIKVIGPDGTVEGPNVEYDYLAHPDHVVKVTRLRQRSDDPVPIESAEFFDGRGALLLVKSKAILDGAYRVTGEKEYDQAGRVVRAYAPRVSRNGFLSLETIAPSAPHTTYEYDAEDRIIKRVNPDGTYATYEYRRDCSRAEESVVEIDENGHKKKRVFRMQGELARLEEYRGADGRNAYYPAEPFTLDGVTRYEYGALKQLARLIDPAGNETRIEYDQRGQRVALNDPDIGRWAYEYDRKGRLIGQQDAVGGEVLFEYDPLGRVTRRSDDTGETVRYIYDVCGQGEPCLSRLGKIEYGMDGEVSFDYDVKGRQTRAVKVIDGRAYEIERRYDGYNNLTELVYPNGMVIYYLYDNAGRLKAIADHPDAFEQNKGQASSHPRASLHRLLRLVKVFFLNTGLWFGQVMGCGTAHAAVIGRAAELVSPAPGSTIFSEPVTFTWDKGESVKMYQFEIGSFPGGYDLYSIVTMKNSYTCDTAWPNLDRIYVRLNSFIAKGMESREYVFLIRSPEGSPQRSLLLKPETGTVLKHRTLSLEWTPGRGVRQNYLMIWPVRGGAGIFRDWVDPGVTQMTLPDSLVLDGKPVYVRLFSYLEGRTKLEYCDYMFNTIFWDRAAEVPVMTAPAPGVTLPDETVHFTWVPGTGVTEYRLWIGSALGEHDLAEIETDGVSSADAVVSRREGRVFVRLWYRASDGWDFVDYEYQTLRPNHRPVIECPSRVTGDGEDLVAYIDIRDEDGDPIQLTRPITSEMPRGSSLDVETDLGPGHVRAAFRWPAEQQAMGRYSLPIEVSDGIDRENVEMVIDVTSDHHLETMRLYVKDITYTPLGQVQSIWYGNDTIISYTYDDPTQRLTGMVTKGPGGQVLQNVAYTYDGVGNIVRIDDRVTGRMQAFSYDHLNRLIGNQDSVYGRQTYGYDATGNMIHKDGVGYRYGENGAGAHAVTSRDDGGVFRYDGNGNMVAREQNGIEDRFEFDRLQRLRRVVRSGESVAEYEYDAENGLVSKTTRGRKGAIAGIASGLAFPELFTSQGGSEDITTHFVGNFYERSAEGDRCHIFLAGRRIASVIGDQTVFYHPDHLGSVDLQTDGSGNLLHRFAYRPFGEFAGTDSGYAQGEGYYFNDQHFEPETGMYFYKSRFYDPVLGRFMSPDMSVPSLASSQALNRYSYVYNAPINYTDPSGNLPWLAVAIIAGALIGGGSAAIASERATGDVRFKSVAWGTVMGALSGWTLATPAAQFGAFGGLLHVSSGAGLAAQVSNAAGWADGASALQTASMAAGTAYMAWHIGLGMRDWAHEKRFGIYRKDGAGDFIRDNESVFVNGMSTSLEGANGALSQAWESGADVLAFNPTTSMIADLTEASLAKLLFTDSVSRQIANKMLGLRNIQIVGYSQGGIIAGNVMMNLGLRDQRTIINRAGFMSTQISQARMFLSAALAGIQSSGVRHSTHVFDFSNVLGPHMNPVYFVGGLAGSATGIGALQAHGRGPEIFQEHMVQHPF